jgi:hypothetical protein
MTTLDVLKDVRELLSDPNHWTKGAYARDARDNFREPRAPDAVKFCLLGALARFDASEYEPALSRLAVGVQRRGQNATLAQFNDASSHEDVLALLDEAIARMKGDEG